MKTARWFATALCAVLALTSVHAVAGKDPLPRKIHIAPAEMPKHPNIVGRGAIWAALLAGPVGAMASTGANNDIETVYSEHLSKNHIDVGADLTFELIDQFTARGFEIVGEEQAEATMQIYVTNYGLSAIGSKGSIPYITSNLVFRDREGKRLKVLVVMTALVKDVEEKVLPQPVTSYFENAKLLMDQMRRMNTLAVAQALKKL
jgi:hypothetical protein